MGEIFDALRRAKLVDDDLKPLDPGAGGPAPATPFALPPLPLEALIDAEPEAPGEEKGRRIELSTNREADWAARLVIAAPSSVAASGFRHAALQVRHALRQSGGSVLAITSPNPGEGKTTTACNLALALASMTSGASVALVDIDLRSPGVASALGLEFEVGFDRVLCGEAGIAEARIRTQFESLDLYPSRRCGRDSHQRLADLRSADVVRDLGSRYDAVILDCPPVLPVPDARLVAEYADACMLVVRAGATRTKSVAAALAYLDHAVIAGVFVNGLGRRGAALRSDACGEGEGAA